MAQKQCPNCKRKSPATYPNCGGCGFNLIDVAIWTMILSDTDGSGLMDGLGDAAGAMAEVAGDVIGGAAEIIGDIAIDV